MLPDWVLCDCVVCVYTHWYTCMGMHADVCTCVSLWTCTCMYMEARGQTPMSSTLFFWDSISSYPIPAEVSGYSHWVPPPPGAGITSTCQHTLHFPPSTWVLGIELRFSCLQDKHLTDWAVSLARLWFLNHFCKLGDFYVCGEGLTADLCFHTVPVALRAKGGCSWILKEYGTSGTVTWGPAY